MQAFEAKPPPLVTGPEGVIRVSGTRVSLETVVYAFDSGSTAEEIVQQYPSLSLGNVYAVISYILDNRQRIDEYIVRRRDEADALRGKIEERSPPDGFRARLLARGAKAPGG